jgi:AraC-like DNA-binding protein
VPAPRRLGLWQDIVCDVFVQLDCKSDQEDFQGAVTQSKLGALALTRVEASRQRVFRTRSRISRANENYLLFAFGAQGEGGVVQDGREALIGPGEFAFYDTTRPYELSFDGNFTQHILQVPRDLAQKRFGSLDHLAAKTFGRHGPLQRLAADFILGISQIIESLDDAAADRLSVQALEMVAIALDHEGRDRATVKSPHRSALLSRLKAYIQARLNDPALSLERTAAALGISPRYINALLEAEQQSFGRYVLAQRLDRCRNDLADPTHRNLQIAEIAYCWGFNDVSHFSRAFRSRFGMAPRDCRASR